LGIRSPADALNFLIMDDNKNISTPKPKKAERQVLSDMEKLNLMIAKNPKLKVLIEKFDLVLINNSQS
jgi:hypothetical protein